MELMMMAQAERTRARTHACRRARGHRGALGAQARALAACGRRCTAGCAPRPRARGQGAPAGGGVGPDVDKEGARGAPRRDNARAALRLARGGGRGSCCGG
eukprot:scaffold1915_cov288-Prasinococcus_capsulatus_cf.AAC.9